MLVGIGNCIIKNEGKIVSRPEEDCDNNEDDDGFCHT